VADELMSRDALAAHARDELGLSKNVFARPIQAALASATSFTLGALLPVILVLLLPARMLVPSMAAATLLLLALLGAIAARLGGASRLTGSLRVGFWGAVAMAATALVGRLFGTAGL
jgi:vacuolar iron transporter family protein